MHSGTVKEEEEGWEKSEQTSCSTMTATTRRDCDVTGLWVLFNSILATNTMKA